MPEQNQCDHPDVAWQRFPDEMGPMQTRPGTNVTSAVVLSYVWICRACGLTSKTDPRRKEADDASA